MYFGQRTMMVVEDKPLKQPIGFVHFKTPPEPNQQLEFVRSVVRRHDYRGWCGLCGSIEGHRANCATRLWSA